jgi:hypothetical protein
LLAVAFAIYCAALKAPVSDTLKTFWNDPNGKTNMANEIKNIFAPTNSIVNNLNSNLVWAAVPFALLGIYSLIKQRNRLAYSVIISVLFVCFAASIGKWPPTGRLWLFLPAVVLIFSAVGHDFISKRNNIAAKRAVFCLFSAITVYYAACGFKYFKDGVYLPTQEANPLILYVREHIKKDETLYAYPPATPTLRFKNGYTSDRIGFSDRANIIYGVNREAWTDTALTAELIPIIKSKKAYLLFQHQWRGVNPGLVVLQKYGTVTEVLNNRDTYLLYFRAAE